MNVFYSTYNKKKPDLRNRMFIVFLKLFFSPRHEHDPEFCIIVSLLFINYKSVFLSYILFAFGCLGRSYK